MIRNSAFRTRARTVDHLGREQIADCPTAISELWKNAFDAYAQRVELNIYDGNEPIAVVIDDGHGMNRDEFEDRWLVVGTESKATVAQTPIKDRNGLRLRPRQGQKGIGRLSCANIGPLLLLVSKRSRRPFVVTLIDWRLFQNPYLDLADIEIPIAEITQFEQIFEQLPDLAESLSENVTGGSDPERKKRIRTAWSASDESEDAKSNGNQPNAVAVDLLSDISNTRFAPYHLRQWPVATGDCDHGTALLVSGINFDLRVLLDERISDVAARGAQGRFFETLSSFVDPFVDPSNRLTAHKDPQFSYAVKVWHGESHRVIVGSEKQFDKRQVDGLEHRIEGTIDHNGIFTGRIRAFGEWLPDSSVIGPPKDLNIPHRTDSQLGPLQLYIASMEFRSANTTHSPSEFQFYQGLAEKYAGFMIFRDGLRVLPYGRTDNDFFDIESRRSRSAGREFWNHRQMFGRLAISREHNPNLKDKAGREGLLDNRAAKTLKGLVSNILMQSARLYFGSASDIRKELLPQIAAENDLKRASEARDRLRRRHRREFRKNLQDHVKTLPDFVSYVDAVATDIKIENEADVLEAQRTLDSIRDRLSDYRLPAVPRALGSLEELYNTYLEMLGVVEHSIVKLDRTFDKETRRIGPTKPDVLLENQIASHTAQIRNHLQSWLRTVGRLQQEENDRIRDIANQRDSIYDSEAMSLFHRFKTGQVSRADTSRALNVLKQRVDDNNREVFESYIGALQSLGDSVDLEHLATVGMETVGELRTELERLNSLAQLGIAVEIVGHELQSYDDMIGAGILQLPSDVRDSEAVKDIELGYEGLTDQLRFLSPLRLAGQKRQRWISGKELFDYLDNFFKLSLAKNKILFCSTEGFRAFRVFERRSRVYPVFINLVNNSVYWLGVSDQDERKIMLDVVGSEVVVADSGPGVAEEDRDSLFTLFFTRKIRGGRGVGLYLCRANLTAGGHTIRYEPDGEQTVLPGANFVISFRGAEFNAG